MSRHLGDVPDDEWDDLIDAFADDVLTRYQVSGSRAGSYSLYRALDDERERAMGIVPDEALRQAVARLLTHGPYLQYIGAGHYDGEIWVDIQRVLKAVRDAEFPPAPPRRMGDPP